MKRIRLWRIRILSVMILIALIALFLGGLHRHQQIASLTAQRDVLLRRLVWASKMEQKGYVSHKATVADENTLREIQTELERLGVRVPPR